jgi:hypothetical protein
VSGGIWALGVDRDLCVVVGGRGSSEGEGDPLVGGCDWVWDGPEDDAVGAGEYEGLGGEVSGGCGQRHVGLCEYVCGVKREKRLFFFQTE